MIAKLLRLQPRHSLSTDEARSAPLAIEGLSVAYHHKPVVWDLSFVAPAQGLVAVVGPNGAGKSTFIKAALGLIPKLSGEITVYGKSVASQRHLIGYVPQRGSVDWDFPASALDVVTMGLYGKIGWLRPVRKAHRATAMGYLEQVGMADFADRQIGQLSGGQQQRVFLARALAQDAALYFMDEPFVGVDAATERAIVNVLKDLKDQGKTVICVHHDLQSAPDYFDHALILNIRPVASGPMAETFTAENLQHAYGGRLAPSELSGLIPLAGQ
ncbi:metal ABC transporter ATP-binding protein [Kiloniella laminariae]|uniref:Metal ABC transporter ATP-binding protein n=1 Tax=Kiloniella laminariae TaxID=454162 RepID=A0ABT4LMS9_9PROT|nr:metal ABC transporter ATP-binding protein [Kiloniella laminariae]MCZ4282374.1 metal ABC transporter ATP-binding protein [Kiloniella laminariae]